MTNWPPISPYGQLLTTPAAERQYVAALKQRFTLRGNFVSSEGAVDEYFDGIAACLFAPQFTRDYFEARLAGAWPCAQGAGGAIILGLLGRGSLYQGSRKNYGLAWNNDVWVGKFGPGRVALVDDCRFTGASMGALRAACESRGLSVLREVVLWPYVELEVPLP